MASQLRTGGLIARRTMNQISTGSQIQTTCRRKIHVSTYDKNLDDELRPATVPDDVFQLQSNKYWAPHPKTGIFGPSTDETSTEGGTTHFSLRSNCRGGAGGSVLDETAWFRTIEGVDKSSYY